MEKLDFIMQLKNVNRGRIGEYADKYQNAKYHPRGKSSANPLWEIPTDMAFPCAVQNEINLEDAKNLVANKVVLVAEGANMPTSNEAITYLTERGVLFAPGKAANAGGVGISAVEMMQNSMRQSFTPEEVDEQLRKIMKRIHDDSLNMAKSFGLKNDYLSGANMVAFLKVANSMIEQGIV
jgi:glutamate dehydrogenase (NADP+)